MKRILLIDDEPGIHLLYRAELEDMGYGVLSAYTGEEGLDMAGKERPDLVILDIELGDMNGIDVLRRMKEGRPDLPVILCSAYGEYKRDFACWASEEYIIKSSDLAPLKETVRRLLGDASGDSAAP